MTQSTIAGKTAISRTSQPLNEEHKVIAWLNFNSEVRRRHVELPELALTSPALNRKGIQAEISV